MSKVSKVSPVTPLDDSSYLVDCYKEASGNIVEIYSNGRRRVYLDFVGDPGCTEQSHKDACDLTYILGQHLKLGGIPPMPESQFNDLTTIPDYQSCLNAVNQIDDLFDTLPLKARQAYDYDPAKFMAAVYDPSQRDNLITLGVFKPMDGSAAGEPAVGSEPVQPVAL